MGILLGTLLNWDIRGIFLSANLIIAAPICSLIDCSMIKKYREAFSIALFFCLIHVIMINLGFAFKWIKDVNYATYEFYG